MAVNKKRLLNPVSLSVAGLLASAVAQAAWSYGDYYWSQDSYVNPTANCFEFACWTGTGGFIEVYLYVDNGQYGPVKSGYDTYYGFSWPLPTIGSLAECDLFQDSSLTAWGQEHQP
jgi:hypothetical protein